MSECLICSSSEVKTFPAGVEPFLEKRMFGRADIRTDLLHCRACGFAYYALRPSQEDSARFYKGYRDAVYQQERRAHESWYTKEINEAIGKNDVELSSRCENLAELIKANIDPCGIKTVLDYGGDKGQHIPPVFKNADKYVYDLSGAVTLEGITPLKDRRALEERKYDFIMCCHTLEHVCAPMALIEEIKTLSSPGGYLYVELPFDSPFYKSKSFYIQFLFSRMFGVRDILKKLFKRGKYKYMMHEHINFFTSRAAVALLEKAGYKIIYAGDKNINFGWIKDRVISVLAQLK